MMLMKRNGNIAMDLLFELEIPSGDCETSKSFPVVFCSVPQEILLICSFYRSLGSYFRSATNSAFRFDEIPCIQPTHAKKNRNRTRLSGGRVALTSLLAFLSHLSERLQTSCADRLEVRLRR